MRKRIAVLVLAAASVAACQQPPAEPPVKEILAVNDQVFVSANDVDGINDRPFRIEPDGTVMLPLVGRIRAEGLTVEQFQKQVTEQLRQFVRAPQVSVKLAAQRSNTILVAGAFRNPGVYPLSERRTLLEVLSTVGGLQENAGRTITITRRLDQGPIPLSSATEDPISKVSAATVQLNRVIGNPTAPENIQIQPNDVLSAEPAGTVYVTGEVLRGGPFEMAQRESIGVAELISMAGGLSRDAAPGKAKVMRRILNGSRRAEIPVDLENILAGNGTDFPVLPNDILVVPRSRGGAAATIRTILPYAVPIASAYVIYRFVYRDRR